MGTDIHGTFQKKSSNGDWVNIPTKFEFDRHYQLFAALANVRNGYGFAGSVTGEEITPISSPKGLPEDYTPEDGIFTGYHSCSHLSGDELVDWYDAAPDVVHKGILSREIYEKWDKVTEPEEYPANYYHGYAVGDCVKLINDTDADKQATPDWNYIHVSWTVDLKAELAYFFNEVCRLKHLCGEIRFVFGFDS